MRLGIHIKESRNVLVEGFTVHHFQHNLIDSVSALPTLTLSDHLND